MWIEKVSAKNILEEFLNLFMYFFYFPRKHDLTSLAKLMCPYLPGERASYHGTKLLEFPRMHEQQFLHFSSLSTLALWS